MSSEDINRSQILDAPPELTREIAGDRWQEINILLHSVVLLGGEVEAREPLLPVLRAAATLASSDRALLFQWDEARGVLRPAAALGFGGGALPPMDSGRQQAQACLLHRKPVLAAARPAAGSRGARLRRPPERPDARASLSVPLTHQGMPWGALQLLRDRAYARDEAVLVWLYALVLEGVLPSLIGSKRHREMTGSIDPTTGLLAPDHFRRRLSWEMQRSAWLARPLMVACIEITEMLHGRPRGGSIPFTPREASAVLQKSLRQQDSVACMGGHHFIAAMPDTGLDEAETVVSNVREGLLLRAAGTLPVFDVVTGFAAYPGDGVSEAELMRAACTAGRRRQRRVSTNPLAG